MELKGIKKRTAEGREVAKNRGVKFGRKRNYTPQQAAAVVEMRQRGDGYGTIASVRDDDIDGSSDHSATGRGALLKILLGVGLGFLLFTNQDARQITADLLRAMAMPLLQR